MASCGGGGPTNPEPAIDLEREHTKNGKIEGATDEIQLNLRLPTQGYTS